MRHAILIIAHADFGRLTDLVRSFDDRFDIYVHIDKKARTDESSLSLLRSLPNVRAAESVYRVAWGARSIMDATLWLCRQALAGSPDVSFFHLISGSDLLVKSADAFCAFFDSHPENNFMEYFQLPYRGWGHGGLNRIEFRHPLDRVDIGTGWGHAVYDRYLNWQIRRGYVRPLPPYRVYGGSTWWSLNRDAVSYVCSHHNWRGWYDRLEDCFAPDEMYIQTLLLNSEYAPTVINDHMRYIVWEYRNGNSPAVLDETDIPGILRSKAVFARKTDSVTSRKLVSYFAEERKK